MPCWAMVVSVVLFAEVAQLVEQRTENPRVGSSILPLGTTFPLISLNFTTSIFN